MYGLIGQTLKHSFSKNIHQLFERYDYEYFELEECELEPFLQREDLKGLNVTIPYKKNVMKYVDWISDSAKRIGCINTIVFKDGKKYGYNTDYDGFRYNLWRKKISVKDKKCLILGNGATSDTCQTVLEDLHAKTITKISRSHEPTFQKIGSFTDYEILINCTPVGMYPHSGETPVSLEPFSALEAVVDVVYNPFHTKLLLDAKKFHIPYVNGFAMLVGQAKRAAELFTGESISTRKVEQVIQHLTKELGNIVLIGMPGSGKSVIGKRVAKKLSKQFIDLDQELIKKYGNIPDIFQKKGERVFREYEHDIVKIFGKLNNAVISTGGGVIIRKENYDALKQNARIVFLQREIDRLDKKGRPLSQTNDLEEMYRNRLPLYQQFADVTIENRYFKTCVEQVITDYEKYTLD